MKKRILIINHPGDIHIGEELYSALEACEQSSGFELHLVNPETETISPDFDRPEFRNALQIIFLVLSPDATERERHKELLADIVKRFDSVPVIAVVEDPEAVNTASLLRAGATEIMSHSLRREDIISLIQRLLQHSDTRKTVAHRIIKKIGMRKFIGEHPDFLEEISKIPLIANCDTNVLITGETGTGKELCARAIHYLSSRSEKPFEAINCGAIPADLVESELFGHVRGAFTSATTSNEGLIKGAEGGTILLDEIDSLPPSSQVKLLRFLQEKEFRQVGSSRTVSADVRVLAASNADLEKMVDENRFRRDLFYRLNILFLNMLPLRRHKEDIPLLARHFLEKYALKHMKNFLGISPEAIRKLLQYDWPGNIRELENSIERAVVFSKTETIQDSDIMLPIRALNTSSAPYHVLKAKVVEEFEKNYIKSVLLAHKGNITRAAQAAQKSRRGFWELIRKHNIDVQGYKNHHN